MDAGDEMTLAVVRLLRLHRVARGLSKAELARRSGMHKSTIGLVEDGKRGLTLAASTRIAHALDLRLADVIAEAESSLRSSVTPNE